MQLGINIASDLMLVIFLELFNKQEKSCFSEVQNISAEMPISLRLSHFIFFNTYIPDFSFFQLASA